MSQRASGGPRVVRGPRVYAVTTVRRPGRRVAADTVRAVAGWLAWGWAWLVVTAGLVLSAAAALLAAAVGWPPPGAVAGVLREHVHARQTTRQAARPDHPEHQPDHGLGHGLDRDHRQCHGRDDDVVVLPDDDLW